MTTLVLLFLAAVVVAWLVHRAGATDTRDETERFAALRELSASWAEQDRAARADAVPAGGTRSDGESGNE